MLCLDSAKLMTPALDRIDLHEVKRLEGSIYGSTNGNH